MSDLPKIFDFNSELARAIDKRLPLISKLHKEGTTAYRLFHGISEGIEGLTVDRYGPLVLVQTFREPLGDRGDGGLNIAIVKQAINECLESKLGLSLKFVYNHRNHKSVQPFGPDEGEFGDLGALGDLNLIECTEFHSRFLVRPRHAGLDPGLFLDLRAARRLIRSIAKDLNVLNLFAYTGSLGVSAAMAGAQQVVNVDFAASNLEVARQNARLNGLPESQFQTIHEDCIPVMRQLAGLVVGGRKFAKKNPAVRGSRGGKSFSSSQVRQSPQYIKLEPREFDLVLLDPPAWSKGRFGAVDVVRDYASLFKPAVLATRAQGGIVIATNHVASVALEPWLDGLLHCAKKAGRTVSSLESLSPESDFPSFDQKPPLKIAVMTLG